MCVLILGGGTASLTENVSYAEGATTCILSPFSNQERANLTLPTATNQGCFLIFGLPDNITNVTVTVGEFVINPTTPGYHSVTVDGESTSVYIKAPPRPPSGGGGVPRDSDGDGYSDIKEMLAGTNPNDPNDYPGAPVATPTPTIAPTPTPTPTLPTPMPTPTPTPTITPTPTPKEPGFEAVFAIAGLLAVAYLVLRRERK